MAPTGDVLAITFLILGVLITLAAFQLLVSALLPGVVARSRETLTRRPVWSGLVGTVTFLVTAGLVQGLTGLGGLGALLGMTLLVAAVTLGVAGLAALSRIVGERLPSAIDTGSPWRPTLRGAVTSELAFAAPVVGWLLFALAVAVAGGAGILGGTGLHRLLGSLRHKPSPPVAEPSAEEAEAPREREPVA